MKNKFIKAFRLLNKLRPMILKQKRLINNCHDEKLIIRMTSRLDDLLRRLYIVERYLKSC